MDSDIQKRVLHFFLKWLKWTYLFSGHLHSANGTISFIEGTAKIVDASEPAKLEVSFFEGKSKTNHYFLLVYFIYESLIWVVHDVCSLSDAPPGPYWVLATDYDEYTLIYSCSDFAGLFHAEFSWIMSRTRTLPKETVSALLDILKSQGISTDGFTETDQRPALCSGMP